MSVVAPRRLPAGRTIGAGGAVTALAADRSAGTVIAATEHGELWRLTVGAGIETLPDRHDPRSWPTRLTFRPHRQR